MMITIYTIIIYVNLVMKMKRVKLFITNLATLLDKYKNISKNNALDAEELINLENTELTGESMMIIKIV